jgi:hypothetical protein
VRHVSAAAEGEFDPAGQIAHGADHIENLASLACEVVRVLHEQDAART